MSEKHARDGRPGETGQIAYPRRRAVRYVLRLLAGLAFFAFCRLRIEGSENVPASGPVILVGNHFHFGDPVAMLWLTRRQVEFIGGFRFIFAPRIVHFLPHLWGYFPAFRGGYSRSTLRSALGVLEQDGVVALFPEGGMWAKVLRPGRPGAAYLALQSGAPVVPVGLDGFTNIFKMRRPDVTIRIGRPIGPFIAPAAKAPRRESVNEVTRQIMLAIAELIPPERRGVHSSDPQIAEAAQAFAANPFEREELRGM